MLVLTFLPFLISASLSLFPLAVVSLSQVAASLAGGFPISDFFALADTAIPNLAGVKYTYEDVFDLTRIRQMTTASGAPRFEVGAVVGVRIRGQ